MPRPTRCRLPAFACSNSATPSWGRRAGLILADLGADVIKIEPVGGDSTRRLCRLCRRFLRHLQPQQAQPRHRSQIRRRPRAAASPGGDRRRRRWKTTRPAPWTGSAAATPISPRPIRGWSIARSRVFSAGPTSIARRSTRWCSSWPGFAYMTGPPGQPLRAGTSVVDIMGGMFAVIGIQAALRERERTGRGQLVKSALFESTAFLMAQHMAGQAVTGRAPPPMPAREGAWAIYEPFETADGEQIFVGLTSDGQWRRFCEHFARAGPVAKSGLQDQRGPRARAPGAAAGRRRNRRAAHARRACRTVRPHRYSVCAGRQARRPVRRSAAQCRRPHARDRLSERRARENSAPADRDRRSRSWRCAARRRRSASTPPKFLPSSGLRKAEIEALRQRGIVAVKPRAERGEDKHERSAGIRAHHRGRPARRISDSRRARSRPRARSR